MGIAPAGLAPPLRAHHGPRENIVFVKPKSKDFLPSFFAKKLAAGGIRVPDKSKFELI